MFHKKEKVYLQYLEEFGCFGISKEVLKDLKARDILADICLPDNEYLYSPRNMPNVGFLLGQDRAKDGTEYYTIDNDYAKSLLLAGARLKFIDYENPYQQTKLCDSVVLPGGCFINPEDFYIDGKAEGKTADKRFFAYKSVIMSAYSDEKPILGICAGAQMVGAILGKMKMYRDINKEVGKMAVHKPQEETDVPVHQITLLKNTPIFDIMQVSAWENTIYINSRHSESMVHSVLQDYVQEKPLVRMDMYAISSADGIPEIWGNEEYGILCVQGHPENLAVKGNEKMENIYKYHVGLAEGYHQRHLKVKLEQKQNNR